MNVQILNRRLLAHTLDTLTATPQIEQVLVVSRDLGALALAREFGARTVQENGLPHLNTALTRATIVAKNYAARGVLIVPADLPLLTSEDILAILNLAIDPPVVVVVPDRRRQGTNAMLVRPAGLIEYKFGHNSFLLHCNLARQAGARLEICELPSIALDMDLPEDLELLSETLEHLRIDEKLG